MGSHKQYPEVKFEVTAKPADSMTGVLSSNKLSNNIHIKSMMEDRERRMNKFNS